MSVHVTYDDLHRVAQLLDESAEECYEEAGNRDRPVDDRRRWLAQGTAYETAAARLRKIDLTTE